MIHYDNSSEKTKNALLQTFKTLKIAELLRKAGIRKLTVYLLMQFLSFLYF